jgi:hypothetical protein
MLEKLKTNYAICIVWVSLIYFPQSSFHHFEPDNNFAIRCMRALLKVLQLNAFEHRWPSTSADILEQGRKIWKNTSLRRGQDLRFPEAPPTQTWVNPWGTWDLKVRYSPWCHSKPPFLNKATFGYLVRWRASQTSFAFKQSTWPTYNPIEPLDNMVEDIHIG